MRWPTSWQIWEFCGLYRNSFKLIINSFRFLCRICSRQFHWSLFWSTYWQNWGFSLLLGGLVFDKNKDRKLFISSRLHRNPHHILKVLEARLPSIIFAKVPCEHAPLSPIENLTDTLPIRDGHDLIVAVDMGYVFTCLVEVWLLTLCSVNNLKMCKIDPAHRLVHYYVLRWCPVLTIGLGLLLV